MFGPMAQISKLGPRRRFDDDVKAQAAALVVDEGKSVGSVARDLDLAETAVRELVKHSGADCTPRPDGLTTAEREELARLRKENRILRESAASPRDLRGLSTRIAGRRSRLAGHRICENCSTEKSRCIDRARIR